MEPRTAPSNTTLAEPMRPEPFRVVRKRRETSDTVTLALRPASDGSSFAFEPGQFNMVYVFGVGEVPMSISGDPARPQTLVHTVRGVGFIMRVDSRSPAS